jgi:hypothetical protein
LNCNDQIQGGENGQKNTCMEDIRNAYKTVEGKQECCRLYGRHKWDDSTKMNIKEVWF